MGAARSWRAGRERNRRLPPELGEAEMAMLLGHVDPLTGRLARMLSDERERG
jgi:hypothetical protein